MQNAGTTTDTTAPSSPTNLGASSASATQITVSWSASTDNVGVTGYRLERCSGSDCTSFSQIATPSGTSYSNTDLSAGSTYRFRVRATDAAGNVSGYSSVASATTQQPTSGGPAPLPEGQNGIAAGYPGDANIGADPDVLFADDFESYSSKSELTSNWTSYYHSPNTRIATEADNVFSGNQSLEFKLPQTSSEVSNAVVKNLNSTQDQLFVRVYTKFDAAYDVTDAGHNGIRISSNYPGPGQKPNGSDFFLFNLENSQYYDEGEPGYTNVYTYHPEQRSQWGDHWYPDGRVLPFDATPGDFGPDFVARPDFIPDTNTWYSYEFMVQANTPGARDGRVAVWIDGNLVADFQNVRVRDVSSLKIDQIQLELHAQGASRVNTKWYDDVVVARSYIGPMSSSTPPPTDTTAPSNPTNLQANPISSSQINLSWAASTDNVGVTGYRLERCSGTSCSSFAQIATPSGTSFSNSGLTAGTTYRYRVRATDAAGNLSSYSSVASATTQPQTTAAEETIWGSRSTTNFASDGQAWDLGLIFTPTTDGQVRGFRVYGAPNESGAHTARLWRNSDGALLSGPHTIIYSGTGWHEFSLPSPVPLTANQTYTVTVSTGEDATGWYTVETQDPGMGTGGNNGLHIAYPPNAGVYSETIGVRPTQSWQQSNYLRDVIFVAESATTDTTAPSIPGNLQANPISTTEISVAWAASTDDVGVSGYQVERCAGASCTDFMQIATPGGTSYSDTGLAANTTYRYRIRATDAAGNVSGYSNTAEAATADTTAPSIPGNLQANPISMTEISLAWAPSTDDVGVSGYQVERCAGASCTDFMQIATPGVTSYSDTGLAANTTYRYRIRATDAAGNVSGYSNTADTATADTTAPSVPGNLQANPISTTEINLAWLAFTDNVGVTGYRLERCAGASCTNFTQIATPSGTSFSDTGLTAGNTYRYRVRATDAAGNLSSYSDVASATTQAEPPTETTDDNVYYPVEVAVWADGDWTPVDAPSGFAEPVVLAGPPSFNDADPGVVRLNNVDDLGFELRFQEWDYRQRLGDTTHALESIPHLVLEPGRHVMSDGSIWEVGTFSLGGTKSWKSVGFTEPFDNAPYLFLTVQTANDPQAVTVRARSVGAAGFQAALFEEEALMNGHGEETVGYLAIESYDGGGAIDIEGVQVPYLLQSVSADEQWTPVLSQWLKVEEEQSKGNEVKHTDETLHVLAFGQKLFAQQVSNNGGDTTALRRLPPSEDASM